jgi:hypothetical protein
MAVNPGSVMAGFRLLARLFPPVPLEAVTSQSLEELKEKYRGRDRWGNLLVFMAFVALAVVFYFLLDGASRLTRPDPGTSGFLIAPGGVELGILAAFLSLFSSGLVVWTLLAWFLGPQEYAIYRAYASYRASPAAPWDIPTVFRWFFLLGFIPLLLFAVLVVDCYTAFTDEAIIDNSLWSLGVRVVHPYSSIRGTYDVQAYHARFNDVSSPYQVIVFDDGTQWVSAQGAGGPKLEEQREILRFVARKSGRQVRPVKFIEDIAR